MRYTEFIWDFDGTLFDTYPYFVSTFKQAMAELGVQADPGHVLALAKVNLATLYEAIGREHGLDTQAVRGAHHRHTRLDGYLQYKPYDGAAALAQAVAQAGGRNYLYTHRGPEAIDAIAHHGMAPYFADYITSADGFPLKPAPDALLFLIEKHGLTPSQCVMLGDRDIDVNAGLHAGTDGALFDPDGFYDDFPFENRFDTMQAIGAAFL